MACAVVASAMTPYCLFELEFARIRHLSPCGRDRIALPDAIRVRVTDYRGTWTPHPNPLPQGERELTAVGDRSPHVLARSNGDRVGTRLRHHCQRNYCLRIACSNSNSRGYATSPLVGEVGSHRQMRSG